jgi:DNA-binding MarR family transcriptional regulator
MNRRHELLSRLEHLGPGIRRRMGQSEPHAEFLRQFGGATLYQVGALRHLVKHGPLTMNELAARMEISPSSATQLVDRLVHHGLVVRNPDPDDRRVLRVEVSGPASVAVRKFEKLSSQRLESLLAPLTDDELETLTSLAQRIVDDTAAVPDGVPRDVPAGRS